MHFNYDLLDGAPRPDGSPGPAACDCELCLGIPEMQKTYENSRFTELWHHRFCKCPDCVESHKNRQMLMAAAHRREIYSELSFITHEHRQGPVFLAWVYEKMRDPKYRKETWWAGSSINRPCAAWIAEWQASFLPREVWAVSGICSSAALTFK